MDTDADGPCFEREAGAQVIAITFAVSAESSNFVRLMTQPVAGRPNELTGTVAQHRVAILHTGVGEKACRARISDFLSRGEFDCLIAAGFAGAIDETLAVGDILLARNFCDATLFDTASKRLEPGRFHAADLTTVPSVIETRAERAQLRRQSAAVAADMETQFIAEACARKGVPMLSLRAISDTADEPFPCPASVLFDIERQKTVPTTLGAYVLKHPGAIPRLLRFARQTARARRALTAALSSVLAG
jgi:adenosylhomocysteine nucleosidase